MKQFLGYVIIIIGYLGLFWAYPYFSSGKDWKTMVISSVAVHVIIAGCFGLVFLVRWAFS